MEESLSSLCHTGSLHDYCKEYSENIFYSQVFIHNPHQRLGTTGGRMSLCQSSSEISLLNINQTVSAITAGVLTQARHGDTLVVGTPTNVLAYDVQNNADVFYKDVCT